MRRAVAIEEERPVKQTISDALARKGYDSLTPVQRAVSQPELEGHDLLVSAQTGSGKTIGFGLAIAPTLLGESDQFGKAAAPLALIIAPTRELAMQVKRELGWLYREAGGFLASCVGGMDMRDERRALERGAHLVVATPGRLRDHIMRGSIDLSNVRAVVLDEADEMLDLGFREDLEFILEETPGERQTLLFSATVPRSIADLAKRYQRDAERINTISTESQHADIEYRAMLVSPRDAENAIINVLRYYEAPNAIVFCNTRAMVARLTTRLSNRGFPVVALSGELTQSERSNALQAMRDGRARVCVATDVAARGIDLPNLDLVVHAELPKTHETLLHRSGRTGRAGRKGVSALITVPSTRKKAERILKFAKLTAEWGNAPSADEINARDEERMLASDEWQQEITENEERAVAQLTETFTPEQIAAAYLRQYKLRHTAPEELGDISVEGPKPRAPFGPSVWFSISEGGKDNASPRHLLPMICKAGNITKHDIGAIRITDDLSYVEIKESSVESFLEAIGSEMKIEGSKAVARLDKAPDLPAFERPKYKGKPAHRKGLPQRRKTDPETYVPRREALAERKAKPSGDGKPRHSTEMPRDFKQRDDKPKGEKRHYKQRDERSRGEKPRSDKPRGEKPKFDKPRNGKLQGEKPRGVKPKGPQPPKGKPSSKKNRARAAAAKAAKTGKGGNAAPKRHKS